MATVGYSSYTEMNLADKMTPPTTFVQQQAKRIITKCKNLKRKIGKVKQKTKKRKDDDVIFVKQVPLHPRERLARETRKQKNDDLIFVRQVPLHPRERLKRKTKRLTHLRERMKNKELQIARENVSAFMEGNFSILPEKMLNKTIFFDVLKVDQETIMDKIIQNLPSANDESYIIHETGTNSFSLRRKDGK